MIGLYDITEEDFDDILEMTSKKSIMKLGMEYQGTFNWVNVDSSMKIRDIYVWKKV